jgi:hypothetical protein
MAKRYVTYMGVTLNSEGAAPLEITKKLSEKGWLPVYGFYDYKHVWGETWGNKGKNINEFLTHLTETHSILKGLNVSYIIKTYEEGTETFPTWETLE